jgi:hypothetical protein
MFMGIDLYSGEAFIQEPSSVGNLQLGPNAVAKRLVDIAFELAHRHLAS